MRASGRTTGEGFVDACDGQYADALAKGHGVNLLQAETTGALGAVFMTVSESWPSSHASPASPTSGPAPPKGRESEPKREPLSTGGPHSQGGPLEP